MVFDRKTKAGKYRQLKPHQVLAKRRWAKSSHAPTVIALEQNPGREDHGYLTTATVAKISSSTQTNHVTNAEIAERLLSMAQLLAAKWENPFKVKAYRHLIRDEALTALKHLVPSGVLQLLFVLGLTFSTRAGGELVLRLTAFLVPHSLVLALGSSGIVTASPPLAARGIEIATGLSLVALAVVTAATTSSTSATLGPAPTNAKEHGAEWPICSGENVRKIYAVKCTRRCKTKNVARRPRGRSRQFTTLIGSARRLEMAVPASVLIGLGELAWTLV